MSYQFQEFPAYRYGPNGESVIVNSEDETPKGFSAKRDKSGADVGARTSIASPNGPKATPEKAAKTTAEVSRASRDVKKAATAGVGGAGERAPNAGNQDPAGTAKTDTAELDADGHPYDANLHAGTGSKTKAGLWRMKVGVARPAPVPGYPKPAAPLDL